MRRAIWFVAASCLSAFPLSADVVKFEPTQGVQTFAVRPPVLRIKPGDTLESRTFSQTRRLLRKGWRLVAGRSRPLLHRRSHARRHARHPDHQGSPEPRHRGVQRPAERDQRRGPGQSDPHAQRSAAGTAVRLDARSRTATSASSSSRTRPRKRIEVAAQPDAGTARGRACRRGGVWRTLARRLRRQHGLARRARGNHGVSADLP